MSLRLGALVAVALVVVAACAAPGPTATPSSAPSERPAPDDSPTELPGATRVVGDGVAPVLTGPPITIDELSGRIVTDNFEDVFAMDVDGSNVVFLADEPGAEFDAAWSPDGQRVVYRDSTRGLNENDEIFVVQADGTSPRNITNMPANDWGPDWSPDGSTIVFNSDRDGGLRGYFVDPDGSNLRPVGVNAWFEYPTWSPDGTRIAFEGHDGSDYEIFVLELESGEVTQLTDAPGDDAWAVWSPDGSTIAFSTERDDCGLVPATEDCWADDEPGDEHRDIWLMAADGSNQRRVTPEAGQFVAFAPDGDHLLISGRALYVVRLDGTGRLELRAEGMPLALGGIPDWIDAPAES